MAWDKFKKKHEEPVDNQLSLNLDKRAIPITPRNRSELLIKERIRLNKPLYFISEGQIKCLVCSNTSFSQVYAQIPYCPYCDIIFEEYE